MISLEFRQKVVQSLSRIVPAEYLDTAFLRIFSFLKIPLLGYVKPKVKELTDEMVRVEIPLRRRSKNHLQSMYFGAIMIGADCAAGYYAAKLVFSKGYRIDLVFKSTQAQFLKLPCGDVEFLCHQGKQISELVEKAEITGEHQELTIDVECRCPETSDEIVALVSLVLSIKKR